LEQTCGDELASEVVQVLGERGLLDEFLDDGCEVAQASYGLKVVIAGAEGSACEGEDEGAVYDFEGDTSAIEVEGGLSVLA
jgi:hypothetical protein